MRGLKPCIVGVLLGALLAITGCSGPAARMRFSANGVQIIDPQAAFTAKTLRDWKDLGDAIVAVQVTAERPDPGTAQTPAGTGGVYGRLVDIVVLHVYWQRDGAPAPPTGFTSKAWGWFNRGNRKQPIVARGEPRLEASHLYLLAIAKFKEGWVGLGDGAEVPFDGGTVGDGEWDGHDPKDKQPALDQLIGKNAAQVQQTIDATNPDPRATQYRDLDPISRAEKIGTNR